MSPLDALDNVAGAATAPWKLWLAGIAFVGAVGAAGLWLNHYGAAKYRAGQAQVQALWDREKVTQQADALARSAANAAETARRLQAQKEAQDAHDTQMAAARRDAAAARTAADGLRRQLALYVDAAATGAAGGNPAAGQLGAPAGTAVRVLADLFGRADDTAGELAAALDASRAAGVQCERGYDALSMQPAH